MAPWWQERIVGFDLETTHADPEKARILSAAVVRAGGGLDTETGYWLANPGVPIPESATKLNGITDHMIREDGRPTVLVLGAILEALLPCLDYGWALAGFNMRYDLTVLDRECRRFDLTPLQEQGDLYVVDGYVVDKHLYRYRPGKRKLADVCAYYRARLDDAHAAVFDALASARLAYALGKRGQVIRREPWSESEAMELRELREEWARIKDDLPALYEAERRWAYGQAISLQEHFVREGKRDYVPRSWPVVPVGGVDDPFPDGYGDGVGPVARNQLALDGALMGLDGFW